MTEEAKVDQADTISPPKDFGFNEETLLYFLGKYSESMTSNIVSRAIASVVLGCVGLLFIAHYFLQKRKLEEEQEKKRNVDTIRQIDLQMQIDLSKSTRAALDAQNLYKFDFILKNIINGTPDNFNKLIPATVNRDIVGQILSEVNTTQAFKAKSIFDLLKG